MDNKLFTQPSLKQIWSKYSIKREINKNIHSSECNSSNQSTGSHQL